MIIVQDKNSIWCNLFYVLSVFGVLSKTGMCVRLCEFPLNNYAQT